MANQALKGFRAARLWPITENTSDSYTTGAKIDLPGAQALTKEVSRSEFTIYADDGVYDSGSDFQYEDLTVTLAELTPELEAELSGGDYDEVDDSYTFKNTDVAPEFGFGYAAMKMDGTYRMFKHYVVKLLSIKIDHQTRGDGNDIQAYELTLRGVQRKADGKIRITQDSATSSYAWLDTIEQYPDTP